MRKKDFYGMSDIYGKLYDISRLNMDRAGREMPLRKDVFIFFTQNKSGEMDLSLTENMDNESFLQAASLGMLLRIPDEKLYDNWSDKFGLPRFEFRKQVMRTFTGAQEFKNKGVIVYNNIYSDEIAKAVKLPEKTEIKPEEIIGQAAAEPVNVPEEVDLEKEVSDEDPKEVE